MYGTIIIIMVLKLRFQFTSKIVIADVLKRITGADLLTHYRLLVDITDEHLFEIIGSSHLGGKGN